MADPVIAPPKFPLNGEREKNGEFAYLSSIRNNPSPASKGVHARRVNVTWISAKGPEVGRAPKRGRGGRGSHPGARATPFHDDWGNKNRGGDGFSATFSWIQNFPLSFSSSLVESFPNYCEFIIKDLRKFKGKFSGERERNMLEKNGKWSLFKFVREKEKRKRGMG